MALAPQIVLPPMVEHNMAIDAALERVESARARGEFLKWFDRELKSMDARLSLERARTDVGAPGFIPGFWHVVRDNSEFGAPKSALPIAGPDGEFREPDSAFLEELRRNDLQRRGALDDLRARQDRKLRDQAADRERGRLERVEEIAGRIKAIDSPGVSMAEGWTYRKAGSRGRASA